MRSGRIRAAACLALAALTCTGFSDANSDQDPASASACGLTDDLVHTLPSLTPPPRGQSYVDPVFGCTIKRLSDGAAEGGGNVVHLYSRVNPFNSDITKVLLFRGPIADIRDLNGNILQDNLDAVGILPTSDAFWSRTDPNLIYFHDWDGNQLRSYDVSTGALNTLQTFSDYSRVSFGMGEGELSADGDHLPVVGDDHWGFIYTISTGTSSEAVDLSVYGSFLDNVDLTPQNRFVVVHDTPMGTELFDSSMNYLGQALDHQGHSDLGRDTDGSDFIAILNAADDTPLPGCASGFVKAKLPGGAEQCLLVTDWLGSHVSCNNLGQGWCLFSTYTDPGRWPAYTNELLMVKLDGSQTLRMAHSRSTNRDYYNEPRAAVSPDGKYALFDSDMQGSTVDAYLLTIPSDGNSPDTTPPVISGVSASTVTSSDATITWATDETGNSQVEYGLTTVYGASTDLDPGLVTAHSQALSGLAAGALYHYRVKSRDAAGNLAVSDDFTFTTLASVPVPSPPDLVAYRAAVPIMVDGVLAEWADAPAVPFRGASNTANAYVLWDATNLYLAFEVKDAELSAVQTTRDATDIYLDDTVEVYIDGSNARATAMQTHDYQFLVNLNNAQGDLRGTGSGKTDTWDGTWTSAVSRQDDGYSVEIAIPWAQIGVTPSSGMYLGMDLAVDDADPSSSTTFDYFDWAGIAPDSYAQPNLWKVVQLR